MITKRPTIYIYTNNPDQAILREICAGIEEEGVLYEVFERPEQDLEQMTWRAANDSMLGSGLGVIGSSAAFQIRGLKPGKFIDYYAFPSKEESRLLGTNSARAIKKRPFKEQQN